ncbi:MAG: acetyl-CoA carboxylase biotin carboxyl carrier protein [Oscillospiraceae bacterium]|nr:acetyl-CoA carboxylase biotin carboxyl carrier protein [Oscillospiraceae bacterium]
MAEKIACNLTFNEIKELINIASEKNLSKIDISVGDTHLILEGASCQTAGPVYAQVQQPQAAQVTESHSDHPEISTATCGKMVKAPIVGTFYASSGPDKAPFVKEGQHIKKGDVLFIIESMKLMNEIQSEFDGTVKKVIVSNGSPVEYDQPIMEIE